MSLNKRKSQKSAKTWLGMLCAGILTFCGDYSCDQAYAMQDFISISGQVYEFDKDSRYETAEAKKQMDVRNGENTWGQCTISGDVARSGEINGIPMYLTDEEVEFFYSFDTNDLTLPETDWNITSDKTKKLGTVKLENDILSGAVMVQTSLDGVTWVNDVILTDVFTGESVLTESIYQVNDIQLQNGCYYKITIAYQMKQRLEDTKVLMFDFDNYQYKKVAEVYEFFVENEKESEVTSLDVPRKELGEKINTGKDNGYSGQYDIDENDPHYGWNIGSFFVNGYTREVADSENNSIFLKNAGDQVVLWFHLNEDINCLNGNSKFTIAEDQDGYDQYFETEKMNFKRGTLIIRHTNDQGVKQEPIIYTNYLEANTRTGADTKVQLFEEGDYEVSLDYEIKNTPRSIGNLAIVPTYTNYKIFFEFSIRNGNCMVYPLDVKQGAELSDYDITEHGFKLDMARSKYLVIDVCKSILKVQKDGSCVEDVRFNRPAKDGESYTDEGIYTFTVRNLYTGQQTEKTIFVGSNRYLKALSKSGITVDEINEQVAMGVEIGEDGSLIEPPKETQAPIEESEEVMAAVSNEVIATQDGVEETKAEHEMGSEIEPVLNESSIEEKGEETHTFLLLHVVIGLLILGTVAYVWKKRGDRAK